ncbi:DUF3604 domain-containing protein [bacterium]|nr:DUF3604 domain-containing protein [bacterium]
MLTVSVVPEAAPSLPVKNPSLTPRTPHSAIVQMNKPIASLFIAATSLVAMIASAENFSGENFEAPKKEYSPSVEDNFPKRALFGDTHLHTNWSTDAAMIGTNLVSDVA